MRAPLSWLREFVDLPDDVGVVRDALDDLGLVVEGLDHVGEGLDHVVVVEVREIHPIEGADKIRRVLVDAGGDEPVEVVCGAWNFEVGDRVPLARVGAVLPGGFEIARRSMRGVTSNGMLCSSSELGLSGDHRGLMVLDPERATTPGEELRDALGLAPDTDFDLSVGANRPDAWSIRGVARDLAIRFERPLRDVTRRTPSAGEPTSVLAAAVIEAPELCGRLTVSVLRGVRVGPSPAWIARRLELAGMRPISNVVDASNMVMLELGQPTHPYDLDRVAGATLRVRRARPGETLETLDGVVRTLAQPGRGLGDTGEDVVIADGEDRVIGLAGIMGGADTEINDATTTVLLEAAHFDPMTIARSVKRHGLRSEASTRFERGVDPERALEAVGRFVALLAESCPDLEWAAAPLDVRGEVTPPSRVVLRPGEVTRQLGTEIDDDVARRLLEGLGFATETVEDGIAVTAPASRPDVRTGAAGRADVVEEVARLYGYRRLARRTPSWPTPGGMTERQVLRRRVRDALVGRGVLEAWTATLVSESHVRRTHPDARLIRVTNPLAEDEAVLRTSLIPGLLDAWARNVARGTGDVRLAELGVVFTHPDDAPGRTTRGGEGGLATLALPRETEHLTVVLGQRGDDARTAVALWRVLADRLRLEDVVVRAAVPPVGWHPTRSADLVDRASGALVGRVGEADPDVVTPLLGPAPASRVGLLEIDVDVLSDPVRTRRRPDGVVVPSRFPSASIDLAFVTPDGVPAADVAHALRGASDVVERVELFDVYRGVGIASGERSLAYGVRLSAPDRTLSEGDVTRAREALIAAGERLGARLR